MPSRGKHSPSTHLRTGWRSTKGSDGRNNGTLTRADVAKVLVRMKPPSVTNDVIELEMPNAAHRMRSLNRLAWLAGE